MYLDLRTLLLWGKPPPLPQVDRRLLKSRNPLHTTCYLPCLKHYFHHHNMLSQSASLSASTLDSLDHNLTSGMLAAEELIPHCQGTALTPTLANLRRQLRFYQLCAKQLKLRTTFLLAL